MKCLKMFLFACMMQVMIVSLAYADQHEKIEKIAQHMHALAPLCTKLASGEMAVKRQQFLNEHKNATAADLVEAIQKKINGKDIIEVLRSLDGPVCRECTKTMVADYDLGCDAIDWWLGGTSIQWAMQLGLLE